jgi:FAD/FMN-containing dehydrogenase
MDFRVTTANRERLWRLCAAFDEIVLAAGGRFYFAKDATLTRSSAQRSFPPSELEAFHALKKEVDPAGILQSDLYRRLFAAGG